MKLHPFGIFRSSNLFHNNRGKLRWTEWFIAILFIVSLLIGSGIFIKASNAANLKTRLHSDLSYGEITTIPGAMRQIDNNSNHERKNPSAVQYEKKVTLVN